MLGSQSYDGSFLYNRLRYLCNQQCLLLKTTDCFDDRVTGVCVARKFVQSCVMVTVNCVIVNKFTMCYLQDRDIFNILLLSLVRIPPPQL